MLVSIIVPFFNSEKYLERCLNSILNQSYTLWELILINDCSSDDSLNIVNKIRLNWVSNNIYLINLSSNQGVSNARNLGMEMASGNYIAFLDSDDVWDLNKLLIQMEFMKNNYSCFISFTSYYKINFNDDIVSNLISVPEIVNFNELLKHNVIPLSSSVIKKDVFNKVKFKNIGHEDYVFWLESLKYFDFALGIDLPLLNYRIVKDSLSYNKFKSARFTWNIYRNVMNYNFIYSFYLFLNYFFRASLKYFK